MRPIQTNYHGYRCRSRLEARWIVFFEQMGIEFIYEPEGWESPDGTRYLPDFYLPHIKFWAEVKPAAFTEAEMWKAESLVRASQRDLLMLVGPPDFRDYVGITFDADEVTNCTYRLDIYFDSKTFKKWYLQEHRLYGMPGEAMCEYISSDRFKLAIYTARGARFEGAA